MTHYDMKMNWGSGCIDSSSLDFGSRWKCQLHALAALTPGKTAPDTHRIGGWVKFGARLYDKVRTRTQVPLPSSP
jgi:hypothetical protein